MKMNLSFRPKFILPTAALLLSVAILSAEDYLSNPAYIAQRAFGKTEQEARQNALSELSKFFQMSISVQTTETTRADNSGSQSVILDNVSVGSETDLFSVRYTKAKLDKKQRLYEVTAFIERSEAWEVFRPRLESKAQSFEKFYSDAEMQSDLILKIIALKKALQNAHQSGIEKDLDFAAALYPESVELYESTRGHLAGTEPLIKKLCAACSVQIVCTSDFENCVRNKAADFFSGIGMIVSEGDAAYSCLIKISENKSTLPAGTFYKPLLSVEIARGGRTLFSAAGQLQRTGAKDKRIAQQRAYSAIAQYAAKILNEEFLSL